MERLTIAPGSATPSKANSGLLVIPSESETPESRSDCSWGFAGRDGGV